MRDEDLKFQYTKDNHFKWGWGADDAEWFNEPDYNEPFKFTMGRCTREVKSFREECIISTEHLCGQVDKPVYVGLSGGLDSQVVCLSLLELKIPFTACIIVMEDNYNLHDVLNAKAFCEKYDVPYKIFKVDMYEFYSKFVPFIVEKHKMTRTRTMLQLWLQEQVGDGIFIMGGGDLQLSRYTLAPASFDATDGALVNAYSAHERLTPCMFDVLPTPILQHLIVQGSYGTTKYFMYTPEMIASVVLSKEVQAFVDIEDVLFTPAFVPKKNYWLLFNYIAKSQLYKNQWPELMMKPKYHGFEFVEKDKEYWRLRSEAIKKYNTDNGDKTIYVEYKELKEYFTTPGEPKIWYTNPLDKEDSSVNTYLKNLVLRERLNDSLFGEEPDLLDLGY